MRLLALCLGVAPMLALAYGSAVQDAFAEGHAGPAISKLDPKYLVGSWIWDDKTFSKQTCRFWRRVDVPRSTSVSKAKLRITADNSYLVFIDGRKLGQGSELRSLSEYDLSFVLTPGTHILAVEAFNEYAEAGVLAGLQVELEDGRRMEISSDASWRTVPEDQKDWMTKQEPGSDWHAARIVAPFLGAPWTTKPVRVVYSPPLQPIVVKFWQRGWFQIALIALCCVTAVICLRLVGQLALQSKAQALLQRERARIARDIHDEMGAGLTQLVLFGEVVQSELPGGSQVRKQFDEVSEKGRRLLRSIDEIVWMVNSQRDTLRDFETYVSRYAESFLQLSGVRCRFEADAEIPETAFSLTSRRNLFLAVKEALNNAVRHSGATEVCLKLHVNSEQVTVVVEDNGKGFDTETIDSTRNGLSNMAQRTAEVGGRCTITSRPAAGCRVELAAPLLPAYQQQRLWKRTPKEFNRS